MADGNNGGLIARATEQRADGRVPSLRPILFNTEMVQAILEGRKTATRRLMKPEEAWACENHEDLHSRIQKGDVLWVREAWDFIPCITCGLPCASSPKEIGTTQFCIRPDQMETADGLTDGCFLYRAEGETPVFSTGHRWRPSIHMPRQAARIWLRVTEVFPERLQESINEAGVPMWELGAEGVQIYERCRICIGGGLENRDCRGCALYDQPRWEFSRLWDSTVRKDRLAAEDWAADPWVWVIRFEPCEEPK